jgi:hypothetical protein
MGLVENFWTEKAPRQVAQGVSFNSLLEAPVNPDFSG